MEIEEPKVPNLNDSAKKVTEVANQMRHKAMNARNAAILLTFLLILLSVLVVTQVKAQKNSSDGIVYVLQKKFQFKCSSLQLSNAMLRYTSLKNPEIFVNYSASDSIFEITLSRLKPRNNPDAFPTRKTAIDSLLLSLSNSKSTNRNPMSRLLIFELEKFLSGYGGFMAIYVDYENNGIDTLTTFVLKKRLRVKLPNKNPPKAEVATTAPDTSILKVIIDDTQKYEACIPDPCPDMTIWQKFQDVCSRVPLLLVITLMLLVVAGIRYFLLLSAHYNARADALELMGNRKFSIRSAIAITSVSGLDFRISKTLKNELLDLFHLKSEEKKTKIRADAPPETKSTVLRNCCCCACCSKSETHT